jgi:glutamate/tyrosine decarboxylase-like PLP-dependent enzyme
MSQDPASPAPRKADARPFASMYPYSERFEVHRRLPARGLDRASILAELRAMAHEEDRPYHEGKISGSIYSGDEEHYAFLTEAFGLFAHANVLQRDMYPSATKLEAEIVAMTADLLHGEAVAAHHPGEEVCGVVTFGGTESLMNPMLVYREWGREVKGITAPEVILPTTAHPALEKAAHYFGIRVIHAPVDSGARVDVEFVKKHVGPNTVALVGSAGTYPHGLVDPIEELGRIAQAADVGLHVDGCLGGFILPFAEPLGYRLAPFDFRVPGVTSISADTHKYGFALKGSSVLLYRNKALRRHQYFIAAGWPGGLYCSPGMSGSRSGGIVAATWAAMVSLGREGYQRIAERIFATAAALVAGIRAIPELAVIGEPLFNVAFRSDAVDIFHVNDHLASRGWRLNGLQLPPALHFCVTRPNTAPGVVDRFLADLREAVEYAKKPSRPTPRTGALYGAGGAPPPREHVEGALRAYLDAMHELG